MMYIIEPYFIAHFFYDYLNLIYKLNITIYDKEKNNEKIHRRSYAVSRNTRRLWGKYYRGCIEHQLSFIVRN